MGTSVIFAFPMAWMKNVKLKRNRLKDFRLDESALCCELCDVVGVDVITYCEFTCSFCSKDDFILLIRKL